MKSGPGSVFPLPSLPFVQSVGGLLDLEEPFRTTLLMRFFDNLEPAQIALCVASGAWYWGAGEPEPEKQAQAREEGESGEKWEARVEPAAVARQQNAEGLRESATQDELQPGIAGRVIGPQGERISDARVRLRYGSPGKGAIGSSGGLSLSSGSGAVGMRDSLGPALGPSLLTSTTPRFFEFGGEQDFVELRRSGP